LGRTVDVRGEGLNALSNTAVVHVSWRMQAFLAEREGKRARHCANEAHTGRKMRQGVCVSVTNQSSLCLYGAAYRKATDWWRDEGG